MTSKEILEDVKRRVEKLRKKKGSRRTVERLQRRKALDPALVYNATATAERMSYLSQEKYS
jgi:hypothetical protein